VVSHEGGQTFSNDDLRGVGGRVNQSSRRKDRLFGFWLRFLLRGRFALADPGSGLLNWGGLWCIANRSHLDDEVVELDDLGWFEFYESSRRLGTLTITAFGSFSISGLFSRRIGLFLGALTWLSLRAIVSL
jgi:hypothetical protein